MVVHRGDDWKDDWQSVLDSYSSAQADGPWHYVPRTGEPTTKAVNIYTDQHRGFDYISPRLRIEPDDLLLPNLPEAIHFVCSPERARAIIARVDALVAEGRGADPRAGLASRRPLLCWEPIPDSATQENLQECLAILPTVDVFR